MKKNFTPWALISSLVISSPAQQYQTLNKSVISLFQRALSGLFPIRIFMRIPENYSWQIQRTYSTSSCIGVGGSKRETEKGRVKKSLADAMVNFSPVPPGCSGGLFSHDGPLGSGARRSGPCIWAVILSVCVYMCVWRDSCPAHLPPLWPATFIINPDDQVAMSLCPCQGMLRSDLWTSIRHSSVHVYWSCTAWLTRHPGLGTVPLWIHNEKLYKIKESVCFNSRGFVG